MSWKILGGELSMRLFMIMSFIATLFLGSVATVTHVNSTELGNIPKQEHIEMLYPTVLVRVGNGSGSGTVVYSQLDKDEKYESFILTNGMLYKVVLFLKMNGTLKKNV